MATGIIGDIAATDKAHYIKFTSGIILAWGELFVPSSYTAGGGTLKYYGRAAVDLSAYGFTEVYSVYANALDNAAYWNAFVQYIEGTKITITVAGDNANGKNTRWIAIGRWSNG